MECKSILQAHTQSISALQFDSTKIISGALDDGNIRIWNLKTGICVRVIEHHAVSIGDDTIHFV